MILKDTVLSVIPLPKNFLNSLVVLCCLPTPMTLASGGESDVPACGPSASFSVHLASSAVTLAGSVHKSRGDNVVCMWLQLEMMCVVCVDVTEGA